MTRIVTAIVWTSLMIFMVSCNAIRSQAGASSAPAAPGEITTVTVCPDSIAVVKAFYDLNDAGRLDASLALLSDDVTLSFWAEGMQGHHMGEKHLAGKQAVRAILGDPGLRRTSGQPNGPIYHETEVQVSGNEITFMLRPDRLRPNGKPYSPYKIDAIFDGCKIRSLTVIEYITWV